MTHISLTLVEWQEIYYALESKLVGVSRGAYRCEIAKDQKPAFYKACIKEEDKIQKQWTKDLKRIMKKITQEVPV